MKWPIPPPRRDHEGSGGVAPPPGTLGVPDQLAVVASPSGAGFRFVMAEQLGNKLVAAHADQTVDGVHRSPLAHVA
jgi:hypothetical protein